jgi:sodium-dependent phosphate cotransporter
VEHFPASEGVKFNSSIKQAVRFGSGVIQDWCERGGLTEPRLKAVALILIALLMIVFTLRGMTRNMRRLIAHKIEDWLNRVLQRSGFLGILVGVVLTALVQSSSITTSLLIPLFGAGVLSLEAGFPIMIGANIGTTVTALLAALVKGPEAMAVALVHLLFNLCGTMLFFPVPRLRRIPLYLSQRLAELAVRNRIFVVIYIGVVFIALPLLGIKLSEWLGASF